VQRLILSGLVSTALACASLLTVPCAVLATAGSTVSPPVNVSPPTVAGPPVEGRSLTGTNGVWLATEPVSAYGYTWLRCDSAAETCKRISGANTPSYRLTSADAGHPIEFEVTAKHAASVAVRVRSKPTIAVAHSAATINGKTELFIAIALAIFAIVAVLAYDLLIGFDGRVSTSKTVAVFWTYFVASALLGFVMAKFAGYPQALNKLMHSGLEGQYGLLIGGPLGAAIAAKGIVGREVAKDPTAKTHASDAESPNPLQLVQNDAGETDLGDFQYVLFNIVAMVFFVGTIFGSPAAGLPHIPDVLLALTSVGAAGYVAKKTLPNTPAKARLNPAKASVGENINVIGSRLLTGTPANQSPIMVLIAGKQAAIVGASESVPRGEDVVTVRVPPGLAANEKVPVSVITSAPSRIDAGELTIE
jgi:hypothetical protein